MVTKNRPRKLRMLMIERVDLVPKGANPDARIVLYKSQAEEEVHKLDVGAGTPILTLEQRQQARQLWQIWGDFCDTVYALMDYHEDGDPAAQAQALLTSIEQFHTQAEAALRTLGLLTKAAPSLAILQAVSQEVQKAGAVMSAARRQRLQAAIEALQAILDEAAPKEATTTTKGVRMSAYDEMQRLGKMKVQSGACPTIEQAIVAVAKERPDLRQRYYAEPRPVLVAKREEPPAKHWSLAKLEEKARALVAKGLALTKEQAMVQAMRTPEGRELAAAYREHQREVARG
jgi:hypothetical protein